MIRRFTQRERSILLVCVTVVLCCVFFNKVIVPLQRKTDFLNEEIMIRKDQLNHDRQVISKAKDLRARYTAYVNHFGRFGTSEEVASSILSEIEEGARKLGLHITNFKPDRVQSDQYYNRFSVSLTMNCELLDVIRFLYLLQQPPYLFSVEEINFETMKKGQKSKIATHLVLGKIFIFDDTIRDKEADTTFSDEEYLISKPRTFRIYEEGIKARDLFRSPMDRTKAGSKIMEKVLPALHKRIKLIGILLDEDSKAIVEDLKEKQTHFLSKGESIGTALLEDIKEDKVIFTYNNQRVEMTP